MLVLINMSIKDIALKIQKKTNADIQISFLMIQGHIGKILSKLLHLMDSNQNIQLTML